MKMPTTIRAATPADVGLILRFIRGLARYEREPDAVTATEDDVVFDQIAKAKSATMMNRFVISKSCKASTR